MTRPLGRYSQGLRSFAVGAGVALLVDLGGFWILVHFHTPPALANVGSSVCSIVAFGIVVRSMFAVRVRGTTVLAFVAWYAVSIGVVSLLIHVALSQIAYRPILWKVVLLPISIAASCCLIAAVRERGARRTRAGQLLLGMLIAFGSVATLSGNTPSVRGAHPLAKPSREIQRLADRFASGHATLGTSIVVGGLGSSVGVGATLADPARDAPVAYFAAALADRVDPAHAARWTVINGSVNGSTIHDALAGDWLALAKFHPDIVVLAYGMNDGSPAEFDTGETYSGAMTDLATLVQDIRATGAIPVLLTSPSPDTVRFDWAAPVGPTVVQLSPVSTVHPVRVVTLSDGLHAPESTRHAAVDAGMRALSRADDVDLIDVEPYWLRAVATHGQSALFNPGQIVHPNLLGHQLSYHAAIDAWMRKAAVPSDLAVSPGP